MCASVTTTAHYLNVKDDYLQELIKRKPLAATRRRKTAHRHDELFLVAAFEKQ